MLMPNIGRGAKTEGAGVTPTDAALIIVAHTPAQPVIAGAICRRVFGNVANHLRTMRLCQRVGGNELLPIEFAAAELQAHPLRHIVATSGGCKSRCRGSTTTLPQCRDRARCSSGRAPRRRTTRVCRFRRAHALHLQRQRLHDASLRFYGRGTSTRGNNLRSTTTLRRGGADAASATPDRPAFH